MARSPDPAVIPPAPRRLTPLGLRRLRREFAFTWPATLALAIWLFLAPTARFLVGRGGYDLLLMARCAEAWGTVEYRLGEKPLPYVASFRFLTEDGAVHENLSFTNDPARLPELGEQVLVEYYPRKPRISRIAGMRCALSSWRVFIFPLIAACAAWPLCFVTDFAIRTLRRRRWLCGHGQVTAGRLLKQNWGEALFFRRRLFRAPCRYTVMNYHFRDAAGRSHKGRAVMRRTPFRLEPGDEVTVIYDPLKPRRSICVEAIGLEFIEKTGQTGSQDQQNQPIKPAPRSCCGPGR